MCVRSFAVHHGDGLVNTKALRETLGVSTPLTMSVIHFITAAQSTSGQRTVGSGSI
jgi:hypothetical protein